MTLLKKLTFIFFVISVVSIVLLSQNIYVEYLQAGIYLIGVISALAFLRMKDSTFKMYVILHFVLLGISSYCIGSKDVWSTWFGPFIAFSFVGFVPLLMASMRRNYNSHGLSLMRQKPWISAVLMGLGYLIYTKAGNVSDARQLPLILLIAMMMITAILVFERFEKVGKPTFYSMVISCLAVIAVNGIWISSMANYGISILSYLTIILVSISCLFLINSADKYQSEETGS